MTSDAHSEQPSVETPADLDGAVAAAVEAGLGTVDQLAEQVTSAFERCIEAGTSAEDAHGDLPGREVLSAYTDALRHR